MSNFTKPFLPGQRKVLKGGKNLASANNDVSGERIFPRPCRQRGGKTTLENGQAWSSPSPTEQSRTEKEKKKKWRKLVVKSSVMPQRELSLAIKEQVR